MASLHANTFSVQLKKIWDPKDKSLYNRDEKSYTAAGYTAYWNAVDKAVKFTDTILLKKEEIKKQKDEKKIHNSNKRHFDKFHWKRPNWRY